MVVFPVLFLLGSLILCGRGETDSSTIDSLRQAALSYQGKLECGNWDCDCIFKQERGCCCGANDLYQLEDKTFIRIMNLWEDLATLNSKVKSVTGNLKIAFKAFLNITLPMPGYTDRCFGPFNTNVPIPFDSVTLNDGMGYNPSLGAFTAPCAGVYAFSFTIYSSVGEDGRLYHKVQLLQNNGVIVSVWEDNREDGEDSASQVVVLQLKKGDQVYLALTSGRKLCANQGYNSFTGYMLYPLNSA
ncbi:cerebellin 18 [Paralichthys olivaceus]|uniref:cerebellin 18 n=1 Tax=Paralichthys olivaceus TaxID=8255 RepID=UPI00097DCB33|nr:PREDICTED: cerebellin-1-like [Paralichthys olivaceus]